MQARADQRKTFSRKILHGRNKGELGVKPRLDGVLVRGRNVGKVAGLQGANVGVDDLGRGEGGSRSAVLETRHRKPRYGSNNDNSGGSRKPSPSGNPYTGRRGGRSITNLTEPLA